MSGPYEMVVAGGAITFRVDRLRRDHDGLLGELTVGCTLPGASTVNGYLTTGDFNFSSVRARQDRAKLLGQRANTNGGVDWFSLVEDFCQNVFQIERNGDPAVDLRQLPRPEPADDLRVEGLVFPKRHPSILFGDGGSAKSYTGLYLAGQLAHRGLRVALFDWELCGEDHRDRLERLFGAQMPEVLYGRCERPLTSEADRLRRIVREQKIDFALFDSIAFACDGRPEDAEVAARYFRAVREIGCGSIHIAHVNKSEDNDKKPFGSSFWHNGARATWFVQAVHSDTTGLHLGFFNRKANLGPLHSPVSLVLTFSTDRTEFRVGDPSQVPELAQKLPIRLRMRNALKHGAMTASDIAEEIDADPETVKRELRRRKTDFVAIDGGLYGLAG